LASFNIEFADEVELAIQEIGQSPELNAAAVVLLQEMDADGTDAVARELGYNYVYYPGSVNHGQDFGNAVLSRWPIVADEKLILPHRNPTNGRIRIAVSATLDTPSGSVVAFSVHTETPWLGPRARLDQARAIVADAEQFTEPVVIGGDFNTLEGRSVDVPGAREPSSPTSAADSVVTSSNGFSPFNSVVT
jgi:endonuclease/exonuclease/phosphatase family metal-dependent hydrolase